MKTAVPKILFGTSVNLERKATIFQGTGSVSPQDPIRLMTAVEAMDRFAEGTPTPVRYYFRGAYAILCEYAHPNLGGVRSFFEIVEETSEGWALKYGYDESVAEADVKSALIAIIQNMRVGYANVLLLISGRFEDRPSGIVYRRTPPELGRWIWENILRDPDSTY